jgi:hypothetical protein
LRLIASAAASARRIDEKDKTSNAAVSPIALE